MEEKKTKNFLYTKGYVCKRLREHEFECKVLPMRYSKEDRRYWSIVVNWNDGNQNLIITCMKEGIPEKYGSFVINGPTFNAYKICTKSIDVLSLSLRELCQPITDILSLKPEN